MSGFFTQKPVYVMGIVNVTPDSFSDGGQFLDAHKAIAHGEALIAQGADILDIGGESTRPGAEDVTPEQEQARILPVIEALSGRGVMVSVDTRNASTMRAAFSAGADMINDVSALEHDAASLSVAASCNGPVCLMHMQGVPGTMQQAPVYKDVVEDVLAYLSARIAVCEAAGIDKARLVADPGFGFGKTLEHNLALLAGFERFQTLGVPILAGLSRKRFIGALAGDIPPDARLAGSLAAAACAIEAGARIVRVHDVAATVQFLRVQAAIHEFSRT